MREYVIFLEIVHGLSAGRMIRSDDVRSTWAG
jgi:hypothetical protein